MHECTNLNIPDTLIYEQLFYFIIRNSLLPQIWYLTLKEGKICRKYKYNITMENIISRFQMKYTRSDIIGTEYKFEGDKNSKTCISSEYITKELLTSY